MSLAFEALITAVRGSGAAFRSVTELQPVGGKGDKIFPATFAGGAYAKEKRRLADGRLADCVLIDSVSSQANRAEVALREAIDRGEIRLPLIEVEFAQADDFLLSPIGKISSLEAPHRLADAILRDSELADGTRFSKSEHAKKWRRSNLWNATAIFELCPTALVFGMWGSPDKPGGLGAKFERSFVSEIVAVDTIEYDPKEAPKRMGFRIDPLGGSSKVPLTAKEDGTFQVGTGKAKASELNHGNIVVESPNAGIRFDHAEQVTVISLGALRKLRFPVDGASTRERDDAGRAALAAIGLCAGVLASEAGTSLRSRCHLLPTAVRQWELVDLPGKPEHKFEMTGAEAAALLNEAAAFAANAGLPWIQEPIKLKPTKELVALVKLSQEIQAKEKGEGKPE